MAAMVVVGVALAGCTASAPSVEPPVLTGSAPSVTVSSVTVIPPPVASSPVTSPPVASSPSNTTSPVASAPSNAPSPTATDGITVSGTVIEGAQPACRNLQTDDDGRYTLTGPGTKELAFGDRVTVTGRPRPDLVNPCGRVFVVTSIH